MKVIEGKKGNPGFVCPWCGLKVFSRDDLEAHWSSPKGRKCKANRNVNNPTQVKYHTPEEEPVVSEPRLRVLKPPEE